MSEAADAGEALARTRPATMKDVAAAAGVGLGTVARAFGSPGRVSEKTRQHVLAVAKSLNYHPSAVGRGLKRQTSDNIGLIVTDVSNNFYGEFAQGVLATAQGMNRHVILGASSEDPAIELDYIKLMLEQRVNGVIAFPTGENVSAWKSAIDLGIKVVFADRILEGIDASSVVVDNVAGARSLTEYLLTLGHRRIGYLGGPATVSSGALRERGFRLAHEQAGIPVDESLLLRTRFTRDTAYASAQRLLEVGHMPSALVAANNILGEAALAAVRDRGLRVPEDISLVMFDDANWAKLVDPPITVVAQPSFEMGQLATRMVLSEEASPALTLPTRLTIRGSARPFRG
jgi:LacI family transcriptional regulator